MRARHSSTPKSFLGPPTLSGDRRCAYDGLRVAVATMETAGGGRLHRSQTWRSAVSSIVALLSSAAAAFIAVHTSALAKKPLTRDDLVEMAAVLRVYSSVCGTKFHLP